jgi:hypothetical protein
MWCDGLVNDTFGFKDQILRWENEIDAYQHFLLRTQDIHSELERQLAECDERIKEAKAVQDQLSKLCSYRELKSQLRNNFSEQKMDQSNR